MRLIDADAMIAEGYQQATRNRYDGKEYWLECRTIDSFPTVEMKCAPVREADEDHIWYKGKQYISLKRAGEMLVENESRRFFAEEKKGHR